MNHTNVKMLMTRETGCGIYGVRDSSQLFCKPKTFKIKSNFFLKEKQSSGREMAFEEVN